jgi:hypothetical protein
MNIARQASSSTYSALTAPAKWLSQYDDFIIKNSSAVSQIESALRSLTYIIPGIYAYSTCATVLTHVKVDSEMQKLLPSHVSPSLIPLYAPLLTIDP